MRILGRNRRISGGVAARLLFVCALLATVALAYFKKEEIKERAAVIRSNWERMQSRSSESESESATEAPSPQPEVDASPETIAPAAPVEEPTPTPTPVPTPTPPPVVIEEKLDHDAIARSPALWPKQVGLTKPVAFPIVFNGRVAGEASVPAGTMLVLSRVIAGPAGEVEVVYQGSKRTIPGNSTDLIQRATAMKNAAPAQPAGAMAARQAVGPSAATSASAAAPAQPSARSANPAEKISLEVVRKKLTRIEGGDWDDKKDRISLRVKFANSDSKVAFKNFQAEVYVFAQSILDPKMTKLVGAEKFPLSLEPFGKHEVSTTECVTAYDTTGARFGHQYQGWIVRVRDDKGALIIDKATTPTLSKSTEKLIKLRVDEETTR